MPRNKPTEARDALPTALDLREQVAQARGWGIIRVTVSFCTYVPQQLFHPPSKRRAHLPNTKLTRTISWAALPKRTSTSYNIMILRHLPRKMIAARLAGRILCEPAQSKRTTPSYNKTNVAANTTQCALGHTRGPRFLRACAVETHVDIIQHHDCAKIPRKMLPAKLAGLILCEPAQSKRTSTSCIITILRRKNHAKCSRTNLRASFRASLRNRNAIRHHATS